MASEPEWSCPICREVSAEIAYVGSCLHEFCRSCILRWARKNPSCPLCRQVVHTIIYPTAPSLQFLELIVPQPFVPPTAGPSDMPGAAAAAPHFYVAGFTPEAWAFFFRNYTDILRPLEMWLNEVLSGSTWWDLAFAHGKVVASLCRFGLDEEALARDLRPFLREQTYSFVRQLIEVASEHCFELIMRLMEIAAMPVGGDGDAEGFAEEELGEQPGAAGAEAAGAGVEASGYGESGDAAPGSSGSSARRRTGGSQGSSAAQEEVCRRQN